MIKIGPEMEMGDANKNLEPGPYCPETGQAQTTSNCWIVLFVALEGSDVLAEPFT